MIVKNHFETAPSMAGFPAILRGKRQPQCLDQRDKKLHSYGCRHSNINIPRYHLPMVDAIYDRHAEQPSKYNGYPYDSRNQIEIVYGHRYKNQR